MRIWILTLRCGIEMLGLAEKAQVQKMRAMELAAAAGAFLAVFVSLVGEIEVTQKKRVTTIL